MLANKEAYEKFIASYNKDENVFSNCAISLAANCKENPFKKGDQGYSEFWALQFHYNIWTKGGVGSKISLRRAMTAARELAEIAPPNPFNDEPMKQTVEEPVKDITQEELKEDVNFLMTCMANAYLRNDEASYEMYVTHLMDTAKENPFLLGTNEYELFSQMMTTYKRNPPNKRKTFVVGKELCDLINHTELYPEKIEKPKQTVLGVLPDEEKKNWRQFLFPWKKDGEQDDGSGAD